MITLIVWSRNTDSEAIASGSEVLDELTAVSDSEQEEKELGYASTEEGN